MINNKKQHQFCLKEIQLMMISKSKQNQSNGSSSIPTNENETGADV
jgi:hypothetical protein